MGPKKEAVSHDMVKSFRVLLTFWHADVQQTLYYTMADTLAGQCMLYAM